MNGWSDLDCFFRADPRDVRCAQAMQMLHVYAELVAAGALAEQRVPGHRSTLAPVRPVRCDTHQRFAHGVAAVGCPGPALPEKDR
jgi:hypothetical protein